MKRISSKLTCFHKKIAPWTTRFLMLLFGFIAIVEVATGTKIADIWQLLVLLPVIALVYWGLLLLLVNDLMDEVWDTGEAIVAKRQGNEETIPLSDIMSVGYWGTVQPNRIILNIRRDTLFGREIAFMPRTRLFPYSRIQSSAI